MINQVLCYKPRSSNKAQPHSPPPRFCRTTEVDEMPMTYDLEDAQQAADGLVEPGLGKISG